MPRSTSSSLNRCATSIAYGVAAREPTIATMGRASRPRSPRDHNTGGGSMIEASSGGNRSSSPTTAAMPAWCAASSAASARSNPTRAAAPRSASGTRHAARMTSSGSTSERARSSLNIDAARDRETGSMLTATATSGSIELVSFPVAPTPASRGNVPENQRPAPRAARTASGPTSEVHYRGLTPGRATQSALRTASTTYENATWQSRESPSWRACPWYAAC